MYAQSGAYDIDLDGNTIASGSGVSVTNVSGIGGGDLDGKYFSEDDYELTSLASTTYTLTASGTGAVDGVTITAYVITHGQTIFHGGQPITGLVISVRIGLMRAYVVFRTLYAVLRTKSRKKSEKKRFFYSCVKNAYLREFC